MTDANELTPELKLPSRVMHEIARLGNVKFREGYVLGMRRITEALSKTPIDDDTRAALRDALANAVAWRSEASDAAWVSPPTMVNEAWTGVGLSIEGRLHHDTRKYGMKELCKHTCEFVSCSSGPWTPRLGWHTGMRDLLHRSRGQESRPSDDDVIAID